MEKDENTPLKLFWSLILSPDKPEEVNGIDSGFLVLSNICIPNYSEEDLGQPIRIYAISETHCESSPDLKDTGAIIVGILVPGSIEFQQLNFKIPPNSKIILKTSGNCDVHIIGHYEYESDQSESDEEEEELPQLNYPIKIKSMESKEDPSN